MTEQEIRALMASGRMYNDSDPNLNARRAVAAELLGAYNASHGRPMAERLEILRKLLKSCGKNVHFETTFRCEFGYNISVGDNFYGNADLMILDGGEVTIGESVFIGPKCGLYTTNHAFDPAERVLGGVWARPITLCDRVWLCGGVSINPGVTVGENSIIGSGSVVTKDIPANVIAAGNPCRVIRKITEADRTGYAPEAPGWYE